MTRIQAKQALENTENVLVRGLRGTISDTVTFPPSDGQNTGCEGRWCMNRCKRAR